MLHGWGLVRKIAPHGIEGNKHFASVEPVVAGVLVFWFHHTDDRVRNAIHPNGLAHRIALGEQLLLRVVAEERDVARFCIILVVVEAPLRRGHAADFSEWRQRAHHLNRAAVEEAANLDAIAEFRHHVFAGGSLFRNLDVIVFQPPNEPSRARAARLHAGSAGENDHHVLAESFLIFLDAITEAFARRHHDGDGDDAPGDAEHR